MAKKNHKGRGANGKTLKRESGEAGGNHNDGGPMKSRTETAERGLKHTEILENAEGVLFMG